VGKKSLNRLKNVNFSLIFLLFTILLALIISTPFFSFSNVPIQGTEDQIYSPKTSDAPSEVENFKYYKIITIDHTKLVQPTYVNFPFLISLYDPDLHENVQDNGNDIAFAIDTTWLDHEIELFNKNYNNTHAKLITWVRIPSLSGSVDTNITMYYGNSSMNSRQNPSGVWLASYKGVWHLSESTGNALDSTSYGTSGTASGTINRGSTGVISGAYNFGTNGQINFGDPSDGHFDMSTGSFTISFWLNIDGPTGNYQLPLYKGSTTYNEPGYDFETNYIGESLSFRICDGTNLAESPFMDIDYDNWMYVVGVVDRTSNYIRIFKDGGQQGSGSSISGIGNINNNVALLAPTATYDLDGLLDEIRIANIQRSSGWINTEYLNQKNPNSFYSVGPQQIIPKELSNVNYFTFYKTITIDHTKITGTGSYVNFPFLISIFDSDLRFVVQPDGDDIAFACDKEWLDHEIELFNQSYNATHAQLIAWVRIPFLYTDTDTNISIYYGNSTMSSQANPTGVWDTKYLAIHHMEESPVGILYDSTTSEEDLLTQGSMTSNDLVNAFIGKGINFDNNNDGAVSTSSIIINSFTLSAWVNPDTMQQWDCVIDMGNFDNDFRWMGLESGHFAIDDGVGPTTYTFGSSLITGEWSYILATFDGSTLRGYVNGVFQTSYSSLGWGSINDRFQIGAFAADHFYNLADFFDGIIDEVRILNIQLSDNWIQTEFENQNDPNSFYFVGIENLVSNIPPNTDYFNYYKTIITDHSMISSNNSLINFPLLLSIYDPDLRYDVQSDGDDIAFAQNGKWLDHEIEKFSQVYNTSHAKLTAWVRIPYLYPVSDMNITMYYGNSTMAARQNPSEVWISGYTGVWHLREDPSGTPPQIKDSSAPHSDGSSYGIMTPSDQVSGMIDGALDFDGSNDYIDFGNPTELQITGEITVQAWFKAEVSIDNDYLLVKYGSSGDRGWDISFDDDPTIAPDGWVMFRYSPDGINTFITGYERVKINQWYYVVGVFKPNEYAKLFLNGTQVAINTTGIPPSLNDPSLPIRIGRRSDSSGATSYFDGLVDEARVSDIARSNDWIITEYNNQYSPQSFYSIGEEQYAKDLILSDVQVNSYDLYGNLIPSVNISIYSQTQLIRSGLSNASGSMTFLGIPQAEYNFTVSMSSDIGTHVEIINRTSEAILIDTDFEIVNLTCNVGTNFFEVEDIDGFPLDSGWIIVGNSTSNLQNCTVDVTGKTKFWWVNSVPYEYNYTIYYQDESYNPSIIELSSGTINTANSTIQVQVELTTVEFTVFTIASDEPVSGVKIKLRFDDILGASIVNLTTDQNGIATLRWLTSSLLGGNYSLQLEFYGQNMYFNNTNGGPATVEEYSFIVSGKSSLEFKIPVSLADFQTELVSLNPIDYIEVKWGEILKLRILFNVTKAGGSTNLLGPTYTDSMIFNLIKGGHTIKSGTFSNEEGNIGRHATSIDTSTLDSDTIYLITISGQKSGFSLPSNLILQLSISKNELVLNQSDNDDSLQSVYWLESVDLSVEPYGMVSEEFIIQQNIFQNESHGFSFSLPDLENQWNLSQVVFNIYNITWNVGPSDINITIIDPYGQYYMFHALNHSGDSYLLGKWTGITIDLNKESPTHNNNFEFIIGGSFTGTVDVIAHTHFIRNQISVEYAKFNISNTVSIASEAEGWAINEIIFELYNCRENGTWNIVNPLSDARLNITTNEGFKYSLDAGYGNGTGSLMINDRKLYPLSGEFLFSIESTLNTVFDVVIQVAFIQEFYRNHYLEGLNSTLALNDLSNGGSIHIDVGDHKWTEQYGILKVNGITNGISYFLPSELAMSVVIGGQFFNIVDFSRGYGTFSLTDFDKDLIYSAVISTNQQVNFSLEFLLQYSRTVNYEVMGTVSYTIIQAPSIQGVVPYDSNLGHYLQTIDTSLIDADDYSIRFSVTKDHYFSAMKDLDIKVLTRLTLINGSSEFLRTFQTIYVKDNINFTFSYIDAQLGTGINNLNTFSYIWESYDDLGNVIDNGVETLLFTSNGRYSLNFATETRSIGEYLLIITLDKDNYENRNAMILLFIEKRIFNYSLGDNFKGKQVNVVKGKNVQIEVRLLDPTKGNVPLENATVILSINGMDHVLEESGTGTYLLTFFTENIDAFFAPKILTGIINVSKIDYISQEFQITIIIGMEEIFPGFPTFYFLLILIGILSIAGSVTVYKVYKKAKIPKFIKKARAIQKAIEGDKNIGSNLVYREKEVYVGELMEDYWDALGLSFAKVTGVEIKKIQKFDKEKRNRFTLERQHEYKPLGLALMRWNERIGTEITAKYPEDIQLSDKSLMQIYGTHEYSGDKGVVTLMDGSLNIVSYYTGPEQGYYLLLILDLNDDPDVYESGMVDIVQTILRNLQDDSYLKLLPSLFQRLSVYPSYNEEQLLYYTFQNDIKRMIIHYLQEDGVIAKSELGIWLKDVYKEGFVDIDAAVTELMKMGIVKQVALKDLPSELIFLTKDVFMLRVPPVKLLKEATKRGLPSKLVKSYRSEVNAFYQDYKPSNEDNLNIIEILSLPQVYETFRLLRRSIVTLQDLEKLRKKGVDDPYEVLKKLWDNNLIKVFHDEQNTEYFALLADFYVDYMFPKYITRIIKSAYEQKSKANKILIEYLRVLEQAYIDMRRTS
jgi:hypothetical protein